jgi:hypothetical protein
MGGGGLCLVHVLRFCERAKCWCVGDAMRAARGASALRGRVRTLALRTSDWHSCRSSGRTRVCLGARLVDRCGRASAGACRPAHTRSPRGATSVRHQQKQSSQPLIPRAAPLIVLAATALLFPSFIDKRTRPHTRAAPSHFRSRPPATSSQPRSHVQSAKSDTAI